LRLVDALKYLSTFLSHKSNVHFTFWWSGLDVDFLAARISYSRLSYGELPEFSVFEEAFNAHQNGEPYEILHGGFVKPKRPVNGYYNSAKDLYNLLKPLCKDWSKGDTGSGDSAHVILQTLGFQWY
jgi:hypothetical protein